jgi:hypothetical protein
MRPTAATATKARTGRLNAADAPENSNAKSAEICFPCARVQKKKVQNTIKRANAFFVRYKTYFRSN